MQGLLAALAAYIELAAKKSMCFSTSDCDGFAWFLEYARELDGNTVVYRDGYGQHLNFESPWRTLLFTDKKVQDSTKMFRTRQKSLGLDKKVQD